MMGRLDVVPCLQLQLTELTQRRRRLGVERENLLEGFASIRRAIVFRSDHRRVQEVLLFNFVFRVRQCGRPELGLGILGVEPLWIVVLPT